MPGLAAPEDRFATRLRQQAPFFPISPAAAPFAGLADLQPVPAPGKPATVSGLARSSYIIGLATSFLLHLLMVAFLIVGPLLMGGGRPAPPGIVQAVMIISPALNSPEPMPESSQRTQDHQPPMEHKDAELAAAEKPNPSTEVSKAMQVVSITSPAAELPKISEKPLPPKEPIELSKPAEKKVEPQVKKPLPTTPAQIEEKPGAPVVQTGNSGKTNTLDQNTDPDSEAESFALLRGLRNNWLRPPNSPFYFHCRIKVSYEVGGFVTGVEVISGCGGAMLDDSVQRAVWKTQPLPLSAARGQAGSAVIDFTPQ